LKRTEKGGKSKKPLAGGKKGGHLVGVGDGGCRKTLGSAESETSLSTGVRVRGKRGGKRINNRVLSAWIRSSHSRESEC